METITLKNDSTSSTFFEMKSRGLEPLRYVCTNKTTVHTVCMSKLNIDCKLLQLKLTNSSTCKLDQRVCLLLRHILLICVLVLNYYFQCN